jgi:ribose transport system ATP-binding protein
VLISHILGEVLTYATRIVVMRNGTVVANGAAEEFDRPKLICAMGGTAQLPAPQRKVERAPAETPLRVHVRAKNHTGGIELVARAGEIIGLAGLAGHGQSDSLIDIFDAAGSRSARHVVNGPVALVAGDRQTDGVFPVWSIAENITIRSLRTVTNGPIISWSKARELAEAWKKKIGIKTPDLDDNILSLSGGNQQKALFARALSSNADIVLMDDPMRGVDIGTKLDVYMLIRAEAARGRTFIWYTTEVEELEHCDRAYVFHNNRIVNELARDELTEGRVIQSSFESIA